MGGGVRESQYVCVRVCVYVCVCVYVHPADVGPWYVDSTDMEGRERESEGV